MVGVEMVNALQQGSGRGGVGLLDACAAGWVRQADYNANLRGLHVLFRAIFVSLAMVAGSSASAAIIDYFAVFDVSITEQYSSNPGKYQSINQISIEWQVDTSKADPNRLANWGTRPYNSWRMTIGDHIAVDTNQQEGSLGIAQANNGYGLHGYALPSYMSVWFDGINSWSPTADALNNASASFQFGFAGYDLYGSLSDPNEYAVLNINYLGHTVFGGPVHAPLPPALTLLLAGIAGLGWVSRRKGRQSAQPA